MSEPSTTEIDLAITKREVKQLEDQLAQARDALTKACDYGLFLIHNQYVQTDTARRKLWEFRKQGGAQ